MSPDSLYCPFNIKKEEVPAMLFDIHHTDINEVLDRLFSNVFEFSTEDLAIICAIWN